MEDIIYLIINSFKSTGREEINFSVPPLIHLIWVGSPLPARYLIGPLSFAKLNPGEILVYYLN